MVKIAVVLPSRGKVFSETAAELLRELGPYEHQIYYSHGRPIPDCFNVPTETALADPAITHVLYCEDDMIIPRGILRKMVAIDYPAVALDYPFKADNEATALRDPHGFAFYTGTGFLLVMRQLLEKLPKPIFRANIAWDTMIDRQRVITFWPRELAEGAGYGLQDVNFGLTLYANSLPILVMGEAGQRKLVEGKQVELTKVLRNNVTKNANPPDRDKFLAAMERLTGVRVLTQIPSNIVYIDGQAHLTGGDYEII